MALLGIVLIAVIAWDAFEALVLPRRVTRRLRPTRFFYRTTWRLWNGIARALPPGGRRETYLSFFGPLSLLVLIALWAACLVTGFAMILWGLGLPLNAPSGQPDLGTALYMSGSTFVTLGLGDVTPASRLARVLVVIEAGTGFGFFALVIGYLPVLYQAFSRREVSISLLDARAGSPPTAGELLRRHAGALDDLATLLHEWERWSAELMESHLSYPVLGFFRSQHDNQSWLAALTTVLDTCALVIAGLPGAPARQAHLTFAIARHAVADLAQVFRTMPRAPERDRLPSEALDDLRRLLAADGLALVDGSAVERRLRELRAMYEPYVEALAAYLLFTAPAFTPPHDARDNWRVTAWDDATAGAKLSD